MSLTVCTSSTGGNLLSTSSELRSVLRTTSTGDDAYQLKALQRASRWAQTFLGYPLDVQTYLETVPAFGTRRLMVSRTPIRAVLRLFDSTDTGSATAYCSTDFRVDDADAGFLDRDQGWAWTAGVSYGLDAHIVPDSEARPWLVEYIAGYTLDGIEATSENYSTAGPNGTTSTGRTLPEDIEQAVLLKAADLYLVQPGNVTSKSVGDLSITYGGQSGANTRSEAEDILAPYRRLA